MVLRSSPKAAGCCVAAGSKARSPLPQATAIVKINAADNVAGRDTKILRRGNAQNAVASIGTDPEFSSDLYGDGTRTEFRRIRLAKNFLHLECFRMHLDDVGCLCLAGAALPDDKQRSIRRPADVVGPEAQGNVVTPGRSLPV